VTGPAGPGEGGDQQLDGPFPPWFLRPDDLQRGRGLGDPAKPKQQGRAVFPGREPELVEAQRLPRANVSANSAYAGPRHSASAWSSRASAAVGDSAWRAWVSSAVNRSTSTASPGTSRTYPGERVTTTAAAGPRAWRNRAT
jgi:hypothetical protein